MRKSPFGRFHRIFMDGRLNLKEKNLRFQTQTDASGWNLQGLGQTSIFTRAEPYANELEQYILLNSIKFGTKQSSTFGLGLRDKTSEP